jgi:hypothetical protein
MYLGTEIRTFTSLKEITDYITDQLDQNRALYEDYSQWLGSLLRNCEENHKNEDWYQKSAAAQKSNRAPPKKATETKKMDKKTGKGNKNASSIWISSGNILLSSTEQGQAEVLFNAIEKIGSIIQEQEKFRSSIQQLERIGLGKNVNYILYIEDDAPKKIVVRSKSSMPADESFKFAAELSIPAFYDSDLK